MPGRTLDSSSAYSYIFSTMAETRETVIMDITLLTKFAAVQRLSDVDKSAFSRSRVGTDISAFINLRHPAMPALSRGFFDSNVDPKLQRETKEAKRSSTRLQQSLQAQGVVLLWGILEIGRRKSYT